MKKTLVLYASCYGHTERYAKWIAQTLSCDCADASSFPRARFQEYDTILFGGGIYAGKIRGASLLSKNAELLSGKKLVVFAVGLTSPADAAFYGEALNNSFPESLREAVSFYPLRGGVDYEKLRPFHRMIFGMRNKMLQKQGTISEADQATLQTCDFTERAALAPLLADCRAL